MAATCTATAWKIEPRYGVREFDAFTTSKGLIHNHVKALFQDRDGFLWIGTAGGVSRFDGTRFDNYLLRSHVGTEEVLDFLQTSDGLLRVMTPLGFARFEGDGFRADPINASIDNMDLKVLLQDRTGRIWVGARQGLLTMHASAQELRIVDELSGWNITDIFEDGRGGIWVGSREDGAAFLGPESTSSWRVFGLDAGLPHLIVNDVIEDKEGVVWVATHRGVAYFDGGRFKQPHFQAEFPHPIIYGLHVDRLDRLWFRTALAGVLLWDGSELHHFTQEDGLAHNNTLSMLEDQAGRIWFASNRGLTLYEHHEFRRFDTSDGLASASVTTIYEDRHGIVWVGTVHGFHRHESHRLTTFLVDTSKTVIPPFSRIYSIFEDERRNLWFPSYNGLGFFDGEKFRLFGEDSALPSQEIHGILEDDHHRIWVVTPSGPAYYEDGRWYAIESDLLKDVNVSQMIEDRDGMIWFLTGDYRVIALHSDLDAPAKEIEVSVGPDPIRELCVDGRGFAWFFSASGATCRRDGDIEKLEFSQIGPGTIVFDKVFNPDGTFWLGTNRGLVAYGRRRIHVITDEDGLPGSYVRRIFRASDSTLWLGLTEANLAHMGREEPVGIAKFDGLSFSLLRQEDGLLSNAILSVAEFPDHHLWFLHARGFTRLQHGEFSTYTISQGLAGNRPSEVVKDGSDNYWIGTSGGLNKFRDGLLATYSESDGLLGSTIMDLHVDARDHIWIRTRQGVQRYVEKVVIPKVKLEHISANDELMPPDQDATFTRKDGSLVIHFRGINTGRGADKVQFLYTLGGDAADWIGPTRDTKVTLPLHNMRPGSYTFSVKAFSPDLYPTAEPATFEFTILPPFWLTPWFLILVSVGVVGLTYLWYRRRIRLSLEKARMVHQFQVARDMQMSLMPKAPPEIDGWDICTYCQPAREVGGDYFDFFMTGGEPSRLGVTVVDVSGKSMEAAIIAVMTSGLLHGALAKRRTPEDTLSHINTTLYQKTPKNAFTTAFLAFIDVTAKTMEYANAGQSPPLLLRAGEVVELDVPGLRVPLAAVPDVTYQSNQVQLRPGDLLFLYTDGLSEAMNDHRQMFGRDRIQAILTRMQGRSAQDVVTRILDEMQSFTGGLAPHDDITVVALRLEDEGE